MTYLNGLANVYVRFNACLYTPEENVSIDKVWEETLTELEFANAQGIWDSMRVAGT